MQYLVNDNCIGCGRCAMVCPNVFEMKEDGFARAIDMDVPKEDEEAAEDAANGCPVDAIEET